MRISTLISHTAELIRIVYNSPQPTDKILNDFFRSKKQYGSKERRFVVNTLYFVLRNYILFSYLSEKVPNELSVKFNKDELRVISGLILISLFPAVSSSYNPDDLICKVESEENSHSILSKLLSEDYDQFFSIIKNEFEDIEKNLNSICSLDFNQRELEFLEIRFSLPSFFIAKIIKTYDNIEDLLIFLQNSTEQAPLFLRINELKRPSKNIIQYFHQLGFDFYLSNIIPNCIYSFNRIQLSEIELFRNGSIEVQDEGSQLISLVLNPKDNESILDACAGAGGKSIHIADLQKNSGRIIANDIEYQRLKEIPKRAYKAGISSIETHLYKSGKNNYQEILNLNKGELFDKVIIDAPCTGSGTIRRDPIKKLRINQKFLEKINKNQLRVLEEYSKYVRQGGILLYSTCSILPEENDKIVELFLSKHTEFQKLNILDEINVKFDFCKLRINFNQLSIDFRNTLSDGFFMAKMQKIK